MKSLLDIVPTYKTDEKSCFVKYKLEYCIVKHLSTKGDVEYRLYHQTLRKRFVWFGEELLYWRETSLTESWATYTNLESLESRLEHELKKIREKEIKIQENRKQFHNECIGSRTNKKN